MDLTISPARLGRMAVGLLILALLYRRVAVLGRVTVLLWLGVLGVIAWVGVEGFLHFDAARAFDFGRGSRPKSASRWAVPWSWRCTPI